MYTGFFQRLICSFMVLGSLGLAAQVQVEDHWSPYDYPRTIPDGSKYHIIEKGDTLWDLAGRYLNDPLLWPQLYQANTYIKDPDLIYPGDPVFLDIGVVVTDDSIAQTTDSGDGDSGEFAEMEEFGEGDGEEGDGETVADRSEETSFLDSSSEFVILPAGTRADMECSSYIYEAKTRKEKLPFDFKIMGGEKRTAAMFGHDDIIYLNKGRDFGVQAGQIYGLRRVIKPVYEPGDDFRDKFLGYVIDQVGKVKILAVQDNTCTGLIIDGCSEVRHGDFLVPYEEEPIPLLTELPVIDRHHGFNTEGAGVIAWTEDSYEAVGSDHIVNITLGVNQNVAPSDLFIIYRENPSNMPREGIVLPQIYLGYGVVLKTAPNTATVRIVESVRDIMVGDFMVPLATAMDGILEDGE
ncbi:LysM peptidoglycan-binding domain-containing protein [Acanthopleuribacter pedis]|uniref:LysM peptidoglycan-binding domain-containing protein n=1 Tax=Acanthopleuribacter pedis TaxID=442870 RepID=A0A8J7U595_9BACT|nr:LysM peptidoglycan-binding domain-containing protein [Acanthopleuribacter pedis]MBO1321497.1 LysM peptidoglycan-binding domain-containing protein [Acanthopleuribacter pedis]